MPRSIWKGHITFGLVNVPVNLYPAEQRTDLELHMLDSRNHSRVRYERVNEETGEEVPWNSIVRGYEFSDGNYVVLGDEELKRAAPEATKAIEIENFVAQSEIDPVFFDRPYYLEPAKSGRKGYALLREALNETQRVGIAKVVIRTRQYVAALMPRNHVLALVLLRYAQEIRSTKGLDIPESSAGVSAIELKTARLLIDGMTTKWKPEAYHDEYRDQLMKWIEKRVKAGDTDKPAKLPAPEKEEEPEGPINFTELLKKSMAAQGARPAANHGRKRKDPTKTTAGKVVPRRKAG